MMWHRVILTCGNHIFKSGEEKKTKTHHNTVFNPLPSISRSILLHHCRINNQGLSNVSSQTTAKLPLNKQKQICHTQCSKVKVTLVIIKHRLPGVRLEQSVTQEFKWEITVCFVHNGNLKQISLRGGASVIVSDPQWASSHLNNVINISAYDDLIGEI